MSFFLFQGEELDWFATLESLQQSKADLDSPQIVGTPTAPTPAPGDDSTLISTTAFVMAAVLAMGNSIKGELIGGAPELLNNFEELAAALNNDEDAFATLNAAIAGKAPLVHGHAIGEIVGLVNALNGKASSNHEHNAEHITAGILNIARLAIATKPDAEAGLIANKLMTPERTKEAIDALVADSESIPPGAIMHFPMPTPPTGWLKSNGAAVLRASYSALDTAIYVGDGLNATAEGGYHCTNPADPTNSRDINGDYLTLLDVRGIFVRFLDDGRGIDISRVLGTEQADELKSHSHEIMTGTSSTDSSSVGHHYAGTNKAYNPVPIKAFGGTETRPRNIALLGCIKY